jgi:predicted nucleotidyltransferase
MPVTLNQIRKKRSKILAIAGRHGATNLRVFGSVARGETGPESDLDLLVELEPGRASSITSRSSRTWRKTLIARWTW